MAAPAPQQTATSYGESMLTSNAPPAYIEKQPLGEGQAPAQQQGGQLLQGQYPQQVQITGGVLPQTWPQGYPVLLSCYPCRNLDADPPEASISVRCRRTPFFLNEMPQMAGQMPAMVAAPPPDHPAPHDFFMLALVTTIICGILNLLSLAFGIPAIILAALSMSAKNSKHYPRAKAHGRNALILTVLNIIVTMFLSMLIIGLLAGYGCADSYGAFRSGRCNYFYD